MKTIGKVGKELGINLETIRFYERHGLIVQPVKPESGYRHYDEMTIKRLRFILKAKTLGFTLKEISSLLSLSYDCKQIELIGLKKLALVRDKIADLQRLEKVIEDMTKSCSYNQESMNCPLIESLNA